MTTISQLIAQSNLQGINTVSLAAGNTQASSSTSFSDVLNKALSSTNAAESEAQAENIKLLTGDNTNIHNVVLAAEKAEVALRLTMQIRNKVLDAYNEMMRLQI